MLWCVYYKRKKITRCIYMSARLYNRELVLGDPVTLGSPKWWKGHCSLYQTDPVSNFSAPALTNICCWCCTTCIPLLLTKELQSGLGGNLSLLPISAEIECVTDYRERCLKISIYWVGLGAAIPWSNEHTQSLLVKWTRDAWTNMAGGRIKYTMGLKYFVPKSMEELRE